MYVGLSVERCFNGVWGGCCCDVFVPPCVLVEGWRGGEAASATNKGVRGVRVGPLTRRGRSSGRGARGHSVL